MRHKRFQPPQYMGHTIFTIVCTIKGEEYRCVVYACTQDQALDIIAKSLGEFDKHTDITITERIVPTYKYMDSLPREVAPRLPGFEEL